MCRGADAGTGDKVEGTKRFMAKQKSQKKSQRSQPSATRTSSATIKEAAPQAVTKPAANPLPTPPAAQPSRIWLWPTVGLFAAVVLIGGIVFFLRDSTAPGPTTLPAAVADAATATPTAPVALRPADAPPGVVDYCKRSPKFRDSLGFSTRAALSTIEQGVKGASMVEFDANGQALRSYQDPSWDDAGYLGHVVLDRGGNVYTFPAPYVSLIDNPPDLQNIVYRIDSTTAAMTRFYTLTATAPPTEANPFGIMGLAYDCDTESLYIASVAGSTRDETLGQIVRLDLASREVRFRYEGVDAFGMGLYIGPTGKRLYYGLARTPEIYSIGVDERGDLLDDVKLEITLPDTTLKARRIVFGTDGTLQVRSRPFDFNLIVTSDRPEVVYNYQLDPATQSWQLVQQ